MRNNLSQGSSATEAQKVNRCKSYLRPSDFSKLLGLIIRKKGDFAAEQKTSNPDMSPLAQYSGPW